MNKVVLKRILFSAFFIFTLTFNFCMSFAAGKTHYLTENWYDYGTSKARKSDVTSITFVEAQEEIHKSEYEYIWDLDNIGLKAYFTTDTDVVISIPEGDTLKADRNSNSLFAFFDEVYFNDIGEEVEYSESSSRAVSSNLKKIDNLSLLDTSTVEDMSYMFYNLKNVEELDLSNFNTENVKSMAYMFSGMNKLKNIDITNFNTENVADMQGMFSKLFNVKSIDFKNFDTKNVKNISEMFKDDIKLEHLDLSNLNTSKVSDANRLFSGCKSLKNLKIENLNLVNADNKVNDMFEDCDKLSHIDFANVKLPQNIDFLFKGISSEVLNITNIDTKNVKSMYGLFQDSTSLKNLTISLNTENVENMAEMFSNCENLETLNIPKMNTKKVKRMSMMFYNCKSLKEIDVKNFNTENVEDMISMFANCRDLKKLDLSNFNTRNVEPNCLYEMLSNLVGLEELDLSGNDFVLKYVDESYTKNDIDYFSYYNISLGDLSSLEKIKINDEIAKRAYDLRLTGYWKNVTTNSISTISKDNNTINRFTSGEYEIVPSCKISFEPKNVLNMYDMRFVKGESLNTEGNILKIDENNNVYYNEGIIFSGWFLDKEYKNRVPKVLKIDNDTVLYARVENKKFKVIFNTNGGTEILSQFVEYNKTVSKPNIIPEKKYYRFVGWYKDSDFNEEYDFNEKVTSETEIYARYVFE